MRKKWQVYPEISDKLKNEFPEINPVILQLLANRGIDTQAKVDEFLLPDYGQDQHDPFLFNDMKKAVDRLLKALKKQERVVIYGDYDADGVCATALLFVLFKDLGFKNLEVYIPYRFSEGYGLNKKAISELKKWQTDLIVTVDCGIANRAEIALAEELGMEVIVTDHHHEPQEFPDRALATINPRAKKEKYPFKDLAGVGVAYKLAQALLVESKKYFKDLGPGYEKWLLDLVVVGTVTDCVDLVGENRIFTKYGLTVLNKTRRLGLRALIEQSRLKTGALSTRNISFQIGPRINAAGRLNHASASYRLLISEDESEIRKLAQDLERTNQERQKLTEKMYLEAKEQVEKKKEDYILFALGRKWPLGVIGLVAGKLADEYYRPTLVMGEEEETIVGSGRSVPEFNIIEAVENLKTYLSRYGGHAQACGFTLKDPKKLENFKKDLTKISSRALKSADLRPRLLIDEKLALSEINHELLEELTQFEPYGQGNPEPTILLENVKITGLETVGQNNNHLRVLVCQNEETKKCIGFFLGDFYEKLAIGEKIDLVCEPSFNEWNGNREIQLKIIDIKRKKNG